MAWKFFLERSALACWSAFLSSQKAISPDLLDAGRDREVSAAYRETSRPCAERPFRVRAPFDVGRADYGFVDINAQAEQQTVLLNATA
jgi:hypothetical protein